MGFHMRLTLRSQIWVFLRTLSRSSRVIANNSAFEAAVANISRGHRSEYECFYPCFTSNTPSSHTRR